MPRFAENKPLPQGYSLPELLIGSLIAGSIALATTTLLSRELVANRNAEQFQRLRRQVNQARVFIELETAAANSMVEITNGLQLNGTDASGAYTISYQLLAAGDAGIAGVTFRGPFVLRRSGPAFIPPVDPSVNPRPTLNASISRTNVNLVLLDGLPNAQAFTINPLVNQPRARRIDISLAENGNTYTAAFTLAIANNPNYSLLQQTSAFTANCTPSSPPAGCRNLAISESTSIQEWNTTLSSTTITPSGNPAEVVVYFNRPRPTAANAIRRTSSTTLPCTSKDGCFIDFATGSDITINPPSSGTASPLKLVFTDDVVAVPRS